VFAVLVLLMVVGTCLHFAMTWLERRLMVWAKEIDIAV
jgi:ABC-type nitrate/sulfonate/bicarbonate transport system permease component